MPARNMSKPLSSSYFRQAVFISRRPYARAACAGAAVVVGLAGAGRWLGAGWLVAASGLVAAFGLLLFAVSLAGLYSFYGGPAFRYYRCIVERAELRDARDIAELHIGTYRHARALAALLPRATIHTVDCWNDEAGHAERSLEEIRALDAAPDGDSRLRSARATRWKVPLDDASCDAVVLGIGFHEFDPPAREALLSEAERMLRPGGKVVLFEHVRDVKNALVFGSAVDHWPTREQWVATLIRRFDSVRHVAVSFAVDLFIGRRA